jgi:NADH:ubiquinone reductase (H+-translocating)
LATGEFVKTATVIWTGGIRGNHMLDQAGFATMRGRVKVDAFLRTTEYENVYVVGDCSIVMNPEGKPYPPSGQIATQQGETCAYNLIAAIRNTPPKEFKYVNKGTVASLGKREAVGMVGTRKVKGSKAAFLKKIVDMRYLYIIGGIPLVIRKGRF